MNFIETLRSIHTKTKLPIDEKIDYQLCITMNKWVGFEKNCIKIIGKILPFMFYIEPKHYYYLMYLTIPQRNQVPYHKKIPKIKPKENKLLDKVQYVLGWSNREMKFNKKILEHVVLSNKKYWKKELGLK